MTLYKKILFRNHSDTITDQLKFDKFGIESASEERDLDSINKG